MTNLRRTTAATLMTLLTIGGATALSAAPAQAAAKARVETVAFAGSHYGANSYSACLTGRSNVSRWAGVTILTGCYPLKSNGSGAPTTYAFQFSR